MTTHVHLWQHFSEFFLDKSCGEN